MELGWYVDNQIEKKTQILLCSRLVKSRGQLYHPERFEGQAQTVSLPPSIPLKWSSFIAELPLPAWHTKFPFQRFILCAPFKKQNQTTRPTSIGMQHPSGANIFSQFLLQRSRSVSSSPGRSVVHLVWHCSVRFAANILRQPNGHTKNDPDSWGTIRCKTTWNSMY